MRLVLQKAPAKTVQVIDVLRKANEMRKPVVCLPTVGQVVLIKSKGHESLSCRISEVNADFVRVVDEQRRVFRVNTKALVVAKSEPTSQHRLVLKAKRVYVAPSLEHKGYFRMDPRTKKEAAGPTKIEDPKPEVPEEKPSASALNGQEIVDVVSVVDTRDWVEGEDDKFHPVPGSGTENTCARCGKPHEIHATVKLADGSQAVVGVSCARKESIEKEIKAKLAAAQTGKKLEAELKRAQEKLAQAEEAEKKAHALPLPTLELTEIDLQGGEKMPVLRVGDAEVWLSRPWKQGDPISEERKKAVEYSWRDKRYKEQGLSLPAYSYHQRVKELEKHLARHKKRVELAAAGEFGKVEKSRHSLVLHPTRKQPLQKARRLLLLQKGKTFPTGTIRYWKGQAFKKLPTGEWVPYNLTYGRKATEEEVRQVTSSGKGHHEVEERPDEHPPDKEEPEPTALSPKTTVEGVSVEYDHGAGKEESAKSVKLAATGLRETVEVFKGLGKKMASFGATVRVGKISGLGAANALYQATDKVLLLDDERGKDSLVHETGHLMDQMFHVTGRILPKESYDRIEKIIQERRSSQHRYISNALFRASIAGGREEIEESLRGSMLDLIPVVKEELTQLLTPKPSVAWKALYDYEKTTSMALKAPTKEEAGDPGIQYTAYINREPEVWARMLNQYFAYRYSKTKGSEKPTSSDSYQQMIDAKSHSDVRFESEAAKAGFKYAPRHFMDDKEFQKAVPLIEACLKGTGFIKSILRVLELLGQGERA